MSPPHAPDRGDHLPDAGLACAPVLSPDAGTAPAYRQSLRRVAGLGGTGLLPGLIHAPLHDGEELLQHRRLIEDIEVVLRVLSDPLITNLYPRDLVEAPLQF